MAEGLVAEMRARGRDAAAWPTGALLLAMIIGAGIGLAAWVTTGRHFTRRTAAMQQAVADDQAQLKALRQFAMSFEAKMAPVTSVDQAGQFASATIRFHALPATPELFASTNIRRWSYSFSRTRLYQVYFVVLVFDRAYSNYKVSFIQREGTVPVVVGDASERTVLLQFIGEPAEREVTVNILPR